MALPTHQPVGLSGSEARSQHAIYSDPDILPLTSLCAERIYEQGSIVICWHTVFQ